MNTRQIGVLTREEINNKDLYMTLIGLSDCCAPPYFISIRDLLALQFDINEYKNDEGESEHIDAEHLPALNSIISEMLLVPVTALLIQEK